MVQIDIPAAFVVSQLMLDLGRDAIKTQAAVDPERPPPIYYRFLTRALLFAGAVIAPAGIYLLTGWPGWEQLYWTERVEHVVFEPVNALLPALFVLAIVVAGWAGHVIGYKWLTSGKEKYLRPTYLGLLGLVAVVVLLTHPAFLLVGSYQQYHGDRSAMGSVWSNPHSFGIGWCGVMIYFAAATVWMIWKSRKDACESRPWPVSRQTEEK
jgi:hypothetical protein